MFSSLVGVLPATVLLAFSTVISASVIRGSDITPAVQRRAATPKRYAAYLSAYGYPNVQFTKDFGAGDVSKLTDVYLFAANVSKAVQGGLQTDAAPPTGASAKYYKFDDYMDTYNIGEMGKLTDMSNKVASPSHGPAQIGNKDAVINGLGLASAAKKPNVIVCVGGWVSDFNKNFAAAASSDVNQKAFGRGLAMWVKAQGYDGVDLDWEYPASEFAGADGKSTVLAYSQLLKAIRAEFDAAGGKAWTISIAVPAVGLGGKTGDINACVGDGKDATAVANFNAAVSYFNVMTYDSANGNSVTMGGQSGKKVWTDTITYLKDTAKLKTQFMIGAPTYARYWPLSGACATPYTANSTANPPASCALTPVPGNGFGGAKPTEAGALAFNWLFSIENNGIGAADGWSALWAKWQTGIEKGSTSADGYHWYYDDANYFTWTTPKDISDACAAVGTMDGVLGYFGFSLHQDTIAGTVSGTYPKAGGKNLLADAANGGPSGIFNALATCAGV